MRRLLLVLGLSAITVDAAAADAVLQWARRVALSTPVSGVVAEVAVQPGQRVEKGAPLLRLDARGVEARLSQGRAELRRAKAEFDEAEREKARAEELYERTVLSDHELQKVLIAHGEAAALLSTARATLAQAQMDVDYSTLRAPFDAWVVAVNVAAGETVVTRLEARPLVEVAEAGRMLARTRVREANLASLSGGQPLTVNVAGRSYPGTVERVALEPAAEGLFEVDVSFPVEGLLRAGRRAEVVLP